jgi:hypothetical protein
MGLQHRAGPAVPSHGVLGVTEELSTDASPPMVGGDDHGDLPAGIGPPRPGHPDEATTGKGADHDGAWIPTDRAGLPTRKVATTRAAGPTTDASRPSHGGPTTKGSVTKLGGIDAGG